MPAQGLEGNAHEGAARPRQSVVGRRSCSQTLWPNYSWHLKIACVDCLELFGCFGTKKTAVHECPMTMCYGRVTVRLLCAQREFENQIAPLLLCRNRSPAPSRRARASSRCQPLSVIARTSSACSGDSGGRPCLPLGSKWTRRAGSFE